MDITKATESIELRGTLLMWMAVHGNLCLALRHPGNQGSSRALVEAFVYQIGARLVEEGLLSAQELREAEQLEAEEVTALGLARPRGT